MSKYKLIATDLDGTLLRNDKTISERTKAVLEEASKQGVEIVPCTGRLYRMLPECIKELPFLRYAVCINGAAVFDIRNDVSLAGKLTDLDTSIKIMEYLDTIDVIYDAYVDNTGYMSQSSFDKRYDTKYIVSPFYRNNFENYRTKVPDLKTFLKDKGMDVQKFQFFSQDKKILDDAVEHIHKLYPELMITESNPDDVEINGPEATKGNGLKLLADIMGIDMDEVLSFGDGGNDLSMMKASGFSVAPSNAPEFVKNEADYVTLSNEEDGVADAIEKFILSSLD